MDFQTLAAKFLSDKKLELLSKLLTYIESMIVKGDIVKTKHMITQLKWAVNNQIYQRKPKNTQESEYIANTGSWESKKN